jgi:hypothetical protein
MHSAASAKKTISYNIKIDCFDPDWNIMGSIGAWLKAESQGVTFSTARESQSAHR